MISLSEYIFGIIHVVVLDKVGRHGTYREVARVVAFHDTMTCSQQPHRELIYVYLLHKFHKKYAHTLLVILLSHKQTKADQNNHCAA